MVPRNGAYERLDGGMAPSRGGALRRYPWRKYAIVTSLSIMFVWFFGSEVAKRLGLSRSQSAVTQPPLLSNEDPPLPDPHPPPADPGISLRPTSPATDPDPLKTVYCTSPHPSAPHLVQYALMIDAGSTGSRIHIYKFNHCGPVPAYEYEVFKMTQPGLSAYAGRPREAAGSLDGLLEEAVSVVPPSLWACTPVAVKATAGLRLLGAEQSSEILDAIKLRLHEKFPFSLGDDDVGRVTIMDGKDEGVYAWITANYLLGTIRGDARGSDPSLSSYAVLDLGGASTQIVFEPTFAKPDSSLVEGEHKYDLRFGGNTHVLYQHSYLGYGLMRARLSVHMLIDFMNSLRSAKHTKDDVIGNPCLSKGMTRVVKLVDERGGERNVTMDGGDVGAFEACNRVMQLVMAKDSICEVKPCSFNGVYQPSLLDAFSTGKILLLSYFYDRIHPLLPKQRNSRLTVSTIASFANTVCGGKESWMVRWGDDAIAMKELEDRPEYCLDLTFMHALLRLGYEFGDDREVVIGKQIQGTELGWCLGATITMVGGELKCRI